VEAYGSSNLPTVICVHGWSLDRTAWYYVVRVLGSRCRVVVWDLPGLGESRGPKNGDYSLEKMAGDLAAVLEKCDGSVVLVGHSIGGMIIQTFCRLYPRELGSKVAGIVLEQTTYTNPLNTALGSSFWKAIEAPILVPLNKLTIWLAPLAWLSNWQSYFNGSLHIMTRIASLSGRQTWGQLNHGALLQARAWPAVVSRGNLAMTQFDEQQTLPQINIPVLVVAGENDRMTLPVASERIERLLSHAVPASLKAGHLGLFEQAETLADFIAEFAQRCVPQDGQAGGSQPDRVSRNTETARAAISRRGGV
jgi:pimeloyl-ACP methyl ester carboxylesterase